MSAVKNVQNGKDLQNGHFFDPMAVTWTEKYSSQIDAVWKKFPGFVAKFLATFAILLLSATLKGELQEYTPLKENSRQVFTSLWDFILV